MSAASALAAAKANLVAALTALWAAEDVLVSYGPPVDEPDELVQILDVTFAETDRAPMSPLRHRDFSFTMSGLISVSYGGGIESQQPVTERALALLADISDYVQDSGTSPSTQISLGGAVRWARIAAAVLHENDGLSDDEDISDGRTTSIDFTISGVIRA